jgi:hypothetical protein
VLTDGVDERGVAGGIGTGPAEDDVEHDGSGTGLREAFHQGRVEAAIPGFGWVLLLTQVRFEIEVDQDDRTSGQLSGLVGDQGEGQIVTGADPGGIGTAAGRDEHETDEGDDDADGAGGEAAGGEGGPAERHGATFYQKFRRRLR